MQQQKQQPSRSKPEFNVKRILFAARIFLLVLMVIGVIVTPALYAITGLGVYSVLSGIITSVATVLGASSFFIPVQSTMTPSTSNTASTRLNNMQGGSGAQSTNTKTGQPIFFFNMPLRNPGEFYGHAAARTTLTTRTTNGGSSSIVGAYKSGATWLLKYLELTLPTHSSPSHAYRIGYISAADSGCKSLKGFVQRALEELKVPQYSHHLHLQPLSQLSQAVRDLKQQGLHAVLCIDEFEGFDNKQEFDDTFFEGLRALAQSDGLVLVTASKSPLKELIRGMTRQTSPLFNIVQQISLPPFTESEARNFVHDKSNRAGFTKKESDFFFRQSTLHNTHGEPYWPPLLLQLVGQMLLDEKRAVQRRSLDGRLSDFRFQSEFERQLDETYQAVVRHA